MLARMIFKIYYRFNQSVLSATTGSFFAALRAGRSPPITVITMLIATSTSAEFIGNATVNPSPNRYAAIAFKETVSSVESPTPSKPEQQPIINFSAY